MELRDLNIAVSQNTQEKQFWHDKLKRIEGRTHFTYDYKNMDNDYELKSLNFQLSEEESANVMRLANNSDVRLFVTLTANLLALLYKYNNKEECTIAIPIYSQDDDGKFLNTSLILTNFINKGLTFKQMLLQVSKSVFDVNNNQNYPIDFLLGEYNYKFLDIGILLDSIHNESYLTKLNLNLIFAFEKSDNLLKGQIKYNSKLYKDESIRLIADHYERLLSSVLTWLDTPIDNLEYIGSMELNKILYKFNDTNKEFSMAGNVVDLFEKQVTKTPNAIAVKYRDQCLTYAELNNRSNQLANKLKEMGVGKEDIIALMLQPSTDIAISIWAVLKVGAAYLPIDIDYPQERITYILQDSNANILITNQEQSAIDFPYIKTLYTNEFSENYYVPNLRYTIHLEDLAYVIYTSGSTGQAKGVMVEHGNLINYVISFMDEFNLSVADTVVQVSSYAFDMFVDEFYPILLKGGRHIVTDKDVVIESSLLAKHINDNNCTIISCTPLLLNELNYLNVPLDIRLFISGGDILKKQHIDNLEKMGKVYNTYGPTESTVCVTYYDCSQAADLGAMSSIPIGRPICNYRVYVLDEQLTASPINVFGQLCVAGKGVTRGYLQRKSLTAEKFVENPYVSGERLYLTGDFARWLPDGSLEFSSRVDSQVKIRGFRVELEEVRSCILNYQKISDAVVVLREIREDDKRIFSYIVSDVIIDTNELKCFLQTKLPEHMIPSHIIQLQQIPVNSNGKPDLNKLPMQIEGGHEEIDKFNEIEEHLAAIWSEILGVKRDNITLDANFFDLGGHSFKVTRLSLKLFKEFCISISIKDIFENPRLDKMAALVGQKQKETYWSIEPAPKQQYYPLSSAQKRVYIASQLSQNDTTYNMIGVTIVDGPLAYEKMERAFHKLIQRHESFRTTFDVCHDELVQEIHEDFDFKVEYITTHNLTEDNLSTFASVANQYNQPLKLDTYPLLRVQVLPISNLKNVLIFTMHHIISDGASVDITIRDFIRLYQDEPLPEIKLQYKDYACWQNALSETQILSQKKYWLDQFVDLPQNLNLELPASGVESTGGRVYYQLPGELCKKVKLYTADNNVTAFMLMMSVFSIIVSNYTNSKSVVVGMPLLGRPHIDLEKTIGMFVNVMPLKSEPADELSFKEYLAKIKDAILNAQRNQEFQFDDLVQALNVPRHYDRNPLFSYVFSLDEFDFTREFKASDLTFTQIMDLDTQAPKFDLSLLTTASNGQFIMEFVYKNNIFNESSINKIADDFVDILHQITQNPEITISNIKDGLKSEWQNEYLKSEKIQKQERYWLDRFSDEIPRLNLPLDFAQQAVWEFVGERIEFKLNHELTEILRVMSKETDAMLYMVLLSAVNILLVKYTGQEDIIVGCPITGRLRADMEYTPGIFVNTLPIRNYPESSKAYEEFLNEVKENVLRAYENQDYQFDELIDKLDLRRDISRNPLFDVVFVWQNIEATTLELEKFKFVGYNSGQNPTKLDLMFTAAEAGDEIVFSVEYCANSFRIETIERMSVHLQNLLAVIASDRKIQIGKIDMLSTEERNRLRYEFNDTYAEYPQEKPIQQLFEEQVERTPDNVALIFGENSLTYGELNSKANQLANYLKEKGIGEKTVVSIVETHSIELVISILGVLKASWTYLPIDPSYPTERINYMLEDSCSRLILTNFEAEGIKFDRETININHADLNSYSKENSPNINSMEDLAYLIYTSGSTGTPKGTMIKHRGLTNYIWWAGKTYFKSENEAMALYSSIAFDLTVTSIFTPLITGNKIVIYDNDEKDFILYRILNENKVTVVKLTPAHLMLLRNKDFRSSHIKRFIVGGDDLKSSLAKEISDSFNDIEIYNEYGPTEAVVGSMIYKYEEKDDMKKLSVPIGRPIDNVKIYILDRDLGMLPTGLSGELYIGGSGLARGYLNRPESTAEKFVENPFAPGERMYRTGDLARWLPDGNIEFLGRMDYQVKIRGYRIELGEIESWLLELGGVKEAIVIALDDETGGKYLCAYIVSDEEIPVSELRRRMSESLPEYMVPSYFVRLEKFPLTPNGKVDCKALPAPDGNTDVEYAPPRNAMEEVLARVWGEILGKEKVGIHDNFFELGGHSLKATVAVSRINKELNVELPLKELFTTPSISGISTCIAKTAESEYSAIEIVEKKAYYKASSAQKRMWILQQFEPEGAGYNMPGVLVIDGDLDRKRLESAFSGLVARHEALRTSFGTVEDIIIQRIAEEVNFEIEYSEAVEVDIGETIRNFIRPFDLSKAPLLRVALVKTDENRHFLLFDMHHIISDGTSMSILTKEFMALYEGKKLKTQKMQYKDFSEWQNEYLKSEKMQVQESYWLEQFSGEIPVLNLPLDYLRPANKEFSCGSVKFSLNRGLTEKLRTISKETGATLYMVLLSAVDILLSKYTGQEDIIVGSPIAGRLHADLENIIGVFVNTLAMRSYPESDKIYMEFLNEVKNTALRAYENQGYQFDELIDRLNLQRYINRNPLFDVMFVLQNTEASNLEIEGLKITKYDNGQNPAKFDLSFTAMEVGDEIAFSVEYCVSLFKRKTVERMSNHLQNLLRVISEDRTILLSDIDILSAEERDMILHEFND